MSFAQFGSWLRAGQGGDRARRVVLLLFALTLIVSFALAQLFAILMIILAAALWTESRTFVRTPVDIPLALFIATRILAVILSTNVALSLRSLYTELPYFILFYAVLRTIATERKEVLSVVLWCLVISGMIGSLYGSVGVLTGHFPRAQSISAGYYTFGTYLAATISILIFLGGDREVFRNRILWSVALILLAAGLVFTLNRAHWGIVGGMILLAGVFRERKLLLGAVVAGVAAVVLFPSVAVRLYETIHFASNLSGRDVIWRGARMIMFEHPAFGFGPGTFREIFPLLGELEDKQVGGWHNDFLRVYMEGGLVSLAALFWLLASGAATVIRQVRRLPSGDPGRSRMLALSAGLTAIMLSSLLGSGFLDITIIMMTSLLLALLMRESGHVVGNSVTTQSNV